MTSPPRQGGPSWNDWLHVVLVRDRIQEWDSLDLEVQVEVSNRTRSHSLDPSLLPK